MEVYQLALGESDATAFDLSDATNYPTSSLSGTITNAQLAGSIDLTSKVTGIFLSQMVEQGQILYDKFNHCCRHDCKNILRSQNVTNESKATMFTSANLTGTPTAPTASSGTSSTQSQRHL